MAALVVDRSTSASMSIFAPAIQNRRDVRAGFAPGFFRCQDDFYVRFDLKSLNYRPAIDGMDASKACHAILDDCQASFQLRSTDAIMGLSRR